MIVRRKAGRGKQVRPLALTAVAAFLAVAIVGSLFFFSQQNIMQASGLDVSEFPYGYTGNDEVFRIGVDITSSPPSFSCSGRFQSPEPSIDCWSATVSYGGKSASLKVGEQEQLNPYLAVRLESINARSDLIRPGDYRVTYKIILTDPSFLTLKPSSKLFLAQVGTTGKIPITYANKYPYELAGGIRKSISYAGISITALSDDAFTFRQGSDVRLEAFDAALLGGISISANPYLLIGNPASPTRVSWLQKSSYKASVLTMLQAPYGLESNVPYAVSSPDGAVICPAVVYPACPAGLQHEIINGCSTRDCVAADEGGFIVPAVCSKLALMEACPKGSTPIFDSQGCPAGCSEPKSSTGIIAIVSLLTVFIIAGGLLVWLRRR